MLEDADMERILTAVTNAVSHSIAPMKVQLNSLETGQQGLLARMDQVQAGQRELNESVHHLETGYNAIGRRLDRQSERLDKIEGRLDTLDARLDALDARPHRRTRASPAPLLTLARCAFPTR
jgi:septal ring factor EnvC (AmiA/AmiB activator)